MDRREKEVIDLLESDEFNSLPICTNTTHHGTIFPYIFRVYFDPDTPERGVTVYNYVEQAIKKLEERAKQNDKYLKLEVTQTFMGLNLPTLVAEVSAEDVLSNDVEVWLEKAHQNILKQLYDNLNEIKNGG